MLSQRLRLTFVFLIALAVVQAFVLGAVLLNAADRAERFYLASRLHNEYQALGANKQRLKVWFAQTMLTGDVDIDRRADLTGRMEASLARLSESALKAERIETSWPSETPTVNALTANFETLRGAIHSALVANAIESNQADVWRRMLEVFDRSDGRDMRTVLDEAIARQSEQAEAAALALSSGLARLNQLSVIIAAFAIICCVVAMIYFVRRIERPFASVVRGTQALEQEDFAYRNPVVGSDEFSQIATRLNKIAATLEFAQARDANIRAALDEAVAKRTNELTLSYEKLAHIDQRRRQFFAEVSHELRTPVTVIQGEAEIALRGAAKPSEVYRESLARVHEASLQLGARVNELLNLARPALTRIFHQSR